MARRKFNSFRLVAIALTALATLAIAGWLGSFLWMAPDDANGARRPMAEGALSEVPAVAPPAPPDPKIALLGTDSSISPEALELVLVATSPGRTPREGTALLGTDPRNPQTYAAGASLVNGAVLTEIHPDHVVLELDGKVAVLAIGGKTIARRLAQLVTSSDQTALTVGGAEVVARPLDNFPSSREDLSEIIRPEPFYERDEFAGIKVLAGRNSARLEALGLKPGDIIRTIEGKPLKSVDGAWQKIDDALSTGSSIVVSIERDGNLTSMYLDGSKLAQDPVQMSAMPLPGSPGT
jgi:general secretion pathway protein C